MDAAFHPLTMLSGTSTHVLSSLWSLLVSHLRPIYADFSFFPSSLVARFLDRPRYLRCHVGLEKHTVDEGGRGMRGMWARGMDGWEGGEEDEAVGW